MPGLPIEFHLVQPQPPSLEPNVLAHVLIVQAPSDWLVSNLVSVFDSFISSNPETFMRIAVTTVTPLWAQTILHALGYDYQPLQIPFQLWIDEHAMQLQQPWHARSGHSIMLQIHRRVVPLPDQIDEMHSFLQLSHHSVPSLRAQISLQELISPPASSDQSEVCVPFRLKHLEFDGKLPDELFLPDGSTETIVEEELNQGTCAFHVYATGFQNIMLTVPFDWTAKDPLTHYVYCPHPESDEADVLLHSAPCCLTELDHMRFLHAAGFTRAVVVAEHCKRRGLTFVTYFNNKPMLEVPVKVKSRSPWPLPSVRRPQRCMLNLSDISSADIEHKLLLGIDLADLEAFFLSSHDVLCPWFSHLDLPDFVKHGISSLGHTEGSYYDLSGFDRLVIYTDGTSKSNERRKPPLRVEEQGTPDAWAFAVLGEIYPTGTQPGSLRFLGWHAQRVRYNCDSRFFIGTDQIGAEYAEREALVFAGLWRLSINSDIPTVFRTDSVTTGQQACGEAGFATLHCTHVALRGVFQALTAGLGDEAIEVTHVRGHAGDIWNELVDHVAKFEAAHGHHLARQNLDLRLLGPVLPYFWMIFDRTSGLPSFTAHGFDVCPPDLPSAQPHTSPDHLSLDQSVTKHVSFAFSLASFNVGSLFAQPDGFCGKLSYLRHQMHGHAFNVVGIQESRSPPGLSMAEDILRIAGGADKGHHGVELWISMRQPFAYVQRRPQFVQRSHVQLLHHDPRRIVVRLATTHLNCFIAVLHAPQSGQPLTTRAEWWRETTQLLLDLCQDFPLFVLADANAKTGPSQPPIVFEHDDMMSSSTPCFLDFLGDLGLCLPCTSACHRGRHGTWTNIGRSDQHRIDFVCIPQSFLPYCEHSQVVDSFDAGNAHDDHAATAIQFAWSDTSSCPRFVSKVARHDRTCIAANKDQISLRQLHMPTWTTDIEAQVTHLNSSLLAALAKSCPLRPATPKKAFISAETWELRLSKLRCRKQLCQIRKRRTVNFLACSFHGWAKGFSESHCIEVTQYAVSLACSELRLGCQYWTVANRLRALLRKDKTSHLSTVIDATGTDAAASSILHAP